ncbi:MAG: hypothetical protein R2877_02065 [Bdellovibrionota bacterium]
MKIKVNKLFLANTEKSVDAGHVAESMSSKEFALEQFASCACCGMQRGELVK